jgi:hypothetical protein
MDTATASTSAAAPAAGTILALDLGKYKSVACAYAGDPAAARFDTITTSRDELRKLFARRRPAVVVFEDCALAGWVHDLCAELGQPCRVANTASEAWKFKHANRRTDKDDALRLAQLQALGQLPAVSVPPRPTREWRALIACRQALVGRRCAAQNHVRAVLVGQGLPAPRGAKAWAEAGLQGIARHARPLADCGPDELWRGLLDLALAEYRQARELIEQAEARFDALAEADAGVRLLETVQGPAVSWGRHPQPNRPVHPGHGRHRPHPALARHRGRRSRRTRQPANRVRAVRVPARHRPARRHRVEVAMVNRRFVSPCSWW